jgi:cadmium resistance transport/sequestration family protein
MEILITSLAAFVSTNIDDIFILILFYGNRTFKNREILTGQLLGISSLIVISLIGSLVGLLIDQAYVGILGMVPIYLGAKAIWRIFKKENNDHQTGNQRVEGKNHILTVAGVTIANGGDNIGIYVPLFASVTWTGKVTMVMVFLAMTFFWCATAKYLTRHPYVAKTVDKYGHLITPFVLVLLGIYILYESGTLKLLISK